MHLDPTTISDLGVTPQPGESSLLSSMDSSWTRAGHTRLRERLTQPLSNADEIRAVQHALRLLAPIVAILSATQWALLTEAVRAYLDSPYVALPRRSLELWVVRRRYPDMTRQLVRGIRATASFIRAAADAARVVSDVSKESRVLDSLADRLFAAFGDDALGPLTGLSGGADADYARLDAVVRGTGRAAIEVTLDALSDLDALQSMAIACARPGWVFPELVDDGALFSIEGLRHPLVANCVANDVQLDHSSRALFITGPNMAGKTTLLRACGLAVILAHCGLALPATSGRLSVFDRVLAILTVRDSIMRGESFFLAEVRRVGGLVERVRHERVFAVVDEMFKGTNVLDAADATALVTRGLSRADGSVFMIASHLTELAESLGESPIRFRHMEVVMEAAGPRSTFRLVDGVSRQRLGMYLLKREGVVAALESIERSASAPLPANQRGHLG